MAVYHDKNLIINYIPREMTDEELLGIFGRIGPVKNCRIIRDRNSGVSFGFGFCEYDNAEYARNAILQLNGFRVGDKNLKVSLARVQVCSNSTNLYVKNFPTWVMEQHLFAQFSRFGRIVQCRVLRDHTTQQPKGAAYVLFEGQPGAELAKEQLDGKQWPGCTDGTFLSVRFASPPHRLAYGRSNNMNHTRGNVQAELRNTDSSQLLNGVNQLASQMLAAYSQPRIGQNATFQPNQNRYSQAQDVLGSSNGTQTSVPPYGYLWAGGDVNTADLSNNNQYSITHPVYFPQSPYSVPPQFPTLWKQAFMPTALQSYQYLNGACLRSPESLLSGAPINMPVPNIVGSFLPEDVPRPPNLATMGLNMAPGVTFGKNNDLDRFKNKTTNLKGPNAIYSLYVYNIGNSMTETQLYQLFARFGNVINVSIPKNIRTRLGKNFGFVTFNSHHSARNAIDNMHGFKLQDRTLQVSFKRATGPHVSNSQVKSTIVNGGTHVLKERPKSENGKNVGPQTDRDNSDEEAKQPTTDAKEQSNGLHLSEVKNGSSDGDTRINPVPIDIVDPVEQSNPPDTR